LTFFACSIFFATYFLVLCDQLRCWTYSTYFLRSVLFTSFEVQISDHYNSRRRTATFQTRTLLSSSAYRSQPYGIHILTINDGMSRNWEDILSYCTRLRRLEKISTIRISIRIYGTVLDFWIGAILSVKQICQSLFSDTDSLCKHMNNVLVPEWEESSETSDPIPSILF
jgi:hypothetical protein